jgi:hypothetical protein
MHPSSPLRVHLTLAIIPARPPQTILRVISAAPWAACEATVCFRWRFDLGAAVIVDGDSVWLLAGLLHNMLQVALEVAIFNFVCTYLFSGQTYMNLCVLKVDHRIVTSGHPRRSLSDI